MACRRLIPPAQCPTVIAALLTYVLLYLFIKEKGLESAVGITDSLIVQFVKILFKYRLLKPTYARTPLLIKTEGTISYGSIWKNRKTEEKGVWQYAPTGTWLSLT